MNCQLSNDDFRSMPTASTSYVNHQGTLSSLGQGVRSEGTLHYCILFEALLMFLKLSYLLKSYFQAGSVYGSGIPSNRYINTSQVQDTLMKLLHLVRVSLIVDLLVSVNQATWVYKVCVIISCRELLLQRVNKFEMFQTIDSSIHLIHIHVDTTFV